MNAVVCIICLASCKLTAAERERQYGANSQILDVSTDGFSNLALDEFRQQGFLSRKNSHTQGAMTPILGNMFTGKLQEPAKEQKVIDVVKELVTKYGIEINYLLDGPDYIIDHAFALLHVLPGTYWTLQKADHPARQTVPASISLRTTTAAAIREHVNTRPNAILLTWTSQEEKLGKLIDWKKKLAVMPHGDDEDMQWFQANGFEEEKILQRPFQDLAYSKYMINNRYANATAVDGWLRTTLKDTFSNSPCHQKECRGVVLLSLPGPVRTQKDARQDAGCKVKDDVWKPIVEDWNLIVTFSPLCEKPDTSNLPSWVYVHDERTGLRIGDLIPASTVLVTSSAGLLSMIGGRFLELPVVRIPPYPETLNSLADSVWNSSMGIVHPAFDSGLAGAVQSAFDQIMAPSSREALLAARKQYQERYSWRIDGFEEYRDALALLSLVLPNNADLMRLRDVVHNLTSIPFRPKSFYNASYDKGILSWPSKDIADLAKLEAHLSEVWNYLHQLE